MFNTPIFNLSNISIKLEYKNFAGSIKDRVALFILQDAFLKGFKEVVEVTSGNTGIALGYYAKRFNIKVTIFMPKNYSIERQKLLKLYNVNLILVDGTIKDAIEEAINYLDSNKYYVDQFNNKLNIMAHQYSTAMEILNQIDIKKLDYFVYGVGSGGTITGIGKILKKFGVKIVAVEPKNSAVIYSKKYNKKLKISTHKIEGIGAGFIPSIVDLNLIDDVILVDEEEVLKFAKNMPINGGLSTAANILASYKLEGNILTIAPDSIERYLSRL